LFRRACRALLLSVLLLGTLATVPAAARADRAPNSADRMILWVNCRQLATISDAQLDAWQGRGVGGFVCQSQYVYGMGGTQDWSGDLGSLNGSQYALERQLRDSRLGARLASRGMIAYLGAYLVNYNNVHTPMADWFDDGAWADRVVPAFGRMAAAARALGFAGLAFDQELYTQTRGVQTADWDWTYPGNSHSEAATRRAAFRRGRQMMSAMLANFPHIQLVAYDVHFPHMWGDVVQQEINNHPNAYANRLDINFWDGLSSVDGYDALRLFDAIFYKMPHVGTWDSALSYEYNSTFAALSRSFSNWRYAAPRFNISPFSWIDNGPGGAFEAARSPGYVAQQLMAFRKWGMGGQFGNYAYRGLDGFDYAPYQQAMQAASRPGVVDAEPPTLSIDRFSAGKSRATLRGSAEDNLAVHYVRWRVRRSSGVARMSWNSTSGRSTWTAGVPLQPGKNRIVVQAVDVKGNVAQLSVNATGGAFARERACAARARAKRHRAKRHRGAGRHSGRVRACKRHVR
jgi:hypothetical protein